MKIKKMKMINKVSNCTLCEELNSNGKAFENEYADIVKEGKNILLRDENFTLLPSVGPLNEYHLLIATNLHYKAFSEIDEKMFSRMKVVLESITKYNLNHFALPTIVFEHGSCISNFNDSSCLEHAHLHLLGTKIDVFDKIRDTVKFTQIEFEELLNYNNNSYLFYVDHKHRCWINNTSSVESQYFRKCFAEEIQHSPEQWNWRQYPKIDLVKKVIANYSHLK